MYRNKFDREIFKVVISNKNSRYFFKLAFMCMKPHFGIILNAKFKVKMAINREWII